MDAMHSTDVSASRVSCSRTRHMLPVRLLVCFLSRFTCLLTRTDMDCRLVYGYHSVLRLSLFDLSTRLQSRYSQTHAFLPSYDCLYLYLLT